jgi:hypothetical protein
MRRLFLFALALLLCCGGCAADADKAQWNEVWRDLRGDNMQMRSFGGGDGSRAAKAGD